MATGSRRQGREAALQILYLADICHKRLEDIPEAVLSDTPLTPKIRVFTFHLAEGALAQRAAIDSLIQSYAENWELHRMAAIDRCILRLATFEILYDLETPVNVIIN